MITAPPNIEINLYGNSVPVITRGIPAIHPETVEYEISNEPKSITHFIVIDGELPRAEEVKELYDLADHFEYQPAEIHPYEVIYHFPPRNPGEPYKKVVLIELDENDWFFRHNLDIIKNGQIAKVSWR